MPRRRAKERVLALAGAAAGSVRPRDEVAAEVAEALHEVLPYEALQLTLRDPFADDGHRTLLNLGYSARVVEYVDSDYPERDPSVTALIADRRPLRMRDTDYDYRETYSYVEYWGPEGYGDGMTTPLYAPDGRYVGLLNTSTVDESVLTDDVRDYMELLAGVLGAMVDPLADVAAWLDEERSSRRFVVRADGAVMARDASEEEGRPPVVDRSLVVDLAASLHARPLLATRGLVQDQDGALVQVQMMQTRSSRLADLPVALISLRHVGQPFGLTERETIVLRHISEGACNREVAARLGIAPRTVATHVEHVLRKLGVDSRTGAAARAIEHGLIRLDVRTA
ncbi:MAG: response regulator transcription factor [Gaiellales bacterium]